MAKRREQQILVGQAFDKPNFWIFWCYSIEKTDMAQVFKTIFPFSGMNFQDLRKIWVFSVIQQKIGKI